MDLYRAGEAVLRSSQPLLPFLAPAVYRQPQTRIAAIARHCKPQLQCQNTTARTFTTSLRRRAENEPPQPPSGSSQPHSGSQSEDIADILNDALSGSKGTPTAPATRTSRYASNTAQKTSTPSRASASSSLESPEGGNSMNELLNSMVTLNRPPPQRQSRSGNGGHDTIDRMLDPKGKAVAHSPPVIQQAPMKLTPTLGRTVHVDNDRGMDVARAFRSMEVQVARNQVKRDFNKQRFYERPGMKRKRLKSDRWRRRFKAGFQAAVRRVLKMRKQGW